MDAKTMGEMPANPVQTGLVPDDRGPSWRYGLTKRELFAAMAMQGLAACNPQWPASTDGVHIAVIATELADALIAQLVRDQP